MIVELQIDSADYEFSNQFCQADRFLFLTQMPLHNYSMNECLIGLQPSFWDGHAHLRPHHILLGCFFSNTPPELPGHKK